MILMGLVTVLAIPIFGLTGFHMVLVSRGRTTNEQVTGKFKGGYNPFSRGCWHNCCYTQFGPQYPRFGPDAIYLIPYKAIIIYIFLAAYWSPRNTRRGVRRRKIKPLAPFATIGPINRPTPAAEQEPEPAAMAALPAVLSVAAACAAPRYNIHPAPTTSRVGRSVEFR